MNGAPAPGQSAQTRALGWILIALHLLLGGALLSIGTVLRLPGGVPFLIVGGWITALGIGLALRQSWAWWLGEIGHPIFVLGEVAVLLVSFALTKQGLRAEGMGRLGAAVTALVFLGTALAATVSLVTWFWLRRLEVRALYFRSNPAIPGSPPLSAAKGLGPAVALLAGGALAILGWSRTGQVPRPRGYTAARLTKRGAPGGTSFSSSEPCTMRYATFSGVQFSPDGSRLVGHGGRAACIWAAATGDLVASIRAEGSGSVEATALSSDGRLLAVAESMDRYSGRVLLFDLASGARRSTAPIPVKGSKLFLAFGASFATLLVQTDTQTISAVDTESGAARATWTADGAASLGPVAASSSGRLLAFASDGHGPVRIADVQSGEVHALDLSPDGSEPLRAGTRLPASDGRIESMLFSKDDRMLFLGRYRSIAVLDLDHGREMPRYELPSDSRSGSLVPLSVSPDGTRLLTEMGGFQFPIFRVPGGELVTLGIPHVRVGDERAPLLLEGRLRTFEGWGRMVGSDGRVRSASLLPRTVSSGGPGSRVAPSHCFGSSASPDGSLLALQIDALSNLTLWKADSDEWVDLLSKPGSYGPMVQPVFSTDSARIAVSGSQGIDVWNLPLRKLLYRIGGKDRN